MPLAPTTHKENRMIAHRSYLQGPTGEVDLFVTDSFTTPHIADALACCAAIGVGMLEGAKNIILAKVTPFEIYPVARVNRLDGTYSTWAYGTETGWMVVDSANAAWDEVRAEITDETFAA